jgi:hypothetical protein
MSKHVDNTVYAPGFMGMGAPFSSNILNLIIFVLIVLQFGTRHDRKECEEGCDSHDDGEIDNSILFVIALFFLFVCSCGSNPSCGRSYC